MIPNSLLQSSIHVNEAGNKVGIAKIMEYPLGKRERLLEGFGKSPITLVWCQQRRLRTQSLVLQQASMFDCTVLCLQCRVTALRPTSIRERRCCIPMGSRTIFLVIGFVAVLCQRKDEHVKGLCRAELHKSSLPGMLPIFSPTESKGNGS